MQRPKDFDLKEYLDPLPENEEERKQAVSKIAGWFDTELGMQIKRLIQRQEKALAMFPLTEREADFYRAGINFGHLLEEWGEEIQKERNSYKPVTPGTPTSAFDNLEK